MSTQSPAGIMPMISVDSVDAVRDFYVEKLGFEHKMGVVGKDGGLDFVNVTLGPNALMFMRLPEPVGSDDKRQSVEIYLGVDDVDAYHEQVTAKGVKAADPLTDQWWGDRTFVVEDPNRYRVWFYTNVAEVVPPPGMKIV
jgi:uncharacterized glyoxalase superfamily protein PhnB